MFRPIKYTFYGVSLWAVEDESSYISKYCDLKEDAILHCKDMNKSPIEDNKTNKCIHPDCECLDYCEAIDPWSKSPIKKPPKDNYLRNLDDVRDRVVFLKKRKSVLEQFEHACTEASRHFADDSGKEWGIAQSYAEKAKVIASANPEFMTEYLEILKDQLVSQSDIFGY